MRWATTFALTAVLVIGLTPGSASAATKEMRNTGDYAIGAIQVFDGTYAQGGGRYDALIPPGRFSGWASTDGIYIGPGWCVRRRFWLSGTEASPPGPAQLGDPKIHYGGANGLWVRFHSEIGVDIKALPYSHPDCWNE
ncbi:hypothetical protein O7635_24880 [Asanoa sp. WMMD1127]|uniref:hypothetical protein n=1 Tax=Asanoa sp. WMMD1127 TaxID=3016107 RepID=UPI0024173B62|nr:hypothetical protein [Asanoa sp. WMMD1127]MDG4825095.1 hypothetical protein [Asanoa sp. WMMD1127]